MNPAVSFRELGLPVGRILGKYTPAYLKLLLRTYVASFPTQRVQLATATDGLRGPVRHDCTADVCAPFLEVEDDCICRWTGNVHHCPSSGGCSESVIGNRNRVCTLTGRVTGIDETDMPESVLNDRTDGCGDDGDDEAYAYSARNGSECDRDAEDREAAAVDVSRYRSMIAQAVQSSAKKRSEPVEMEAAPTAAASVPASRCACDDNDTEDRPVVAKKPRIAFSGRIFAAPGEKQISLSELRSLALGVVRRVLKRESVIVSDDTEFDYDAIVEDNIMYLWTEVVSTEHYKAHSQSYPFHFHCVVILHEMINGYPVFDSEGVLRHLIVKQTGFDQLIPGVEAIDLGEFNRGRVLNHKAFIGACKFFKESIKEIMHRRPHALQKLLARESTPRT